MQNKTQFYQNVADYYLQGEISYRDVWDLDRSLAIHYGYSATNQLKLQQDLPLMNKKLALLAEIQKNDSILDAGCGIGGSCIFLASQYQCETHGISISPHQIKQAKKIAKTKYPELKLSFSTQNYEQTNFPDKNFDTVWAMESLCYAPEKADFLNEAHRILKPRGKLAIADGFRTKNTKLDNQSEEILTKWFNGWAMHDIDSINQFLEKAQNKGFKVVKKQNISPNVRPSSRRLFWLGKAALYLEKIHSLLGRNYGNKHSIGNAIGAKNQYIALKNNWWQYYLIILEKK